MQASGHPAEHANLAQRLEEYADLLERQDGDPFRIRAYRRAAGGVRASRGPIREIFETEGTRGLDGLPGVGPGIAAALAEMMETGRWAALDRLRGDSRPEALFRSLPGIGPRLAKRLVDEVDLETLEDLENALHSSETPLPGFGPRRRRAVLAVLNERLSRIRAAPRRAHVPEPSVRFLLEADALYRKRAAEDALPRIAPKRLNPEGTAWLPVLHLQRDGWHLTLMYSNTARAHQLGRTHDWVVVYFHKEGGPEGRRTIVTETAGPHTGQRVVRGREEEEGAGPADGGLLQNIRPAATVNAAKPSAEPKPLSAGSD